MTEPYIEKAREAAKSAYAVAVTSEPARFLTKTADAALDAAFAELAANPPESAVFAAMDGYHGSEEEGDFPAALSAAFSALREKNDE